MSSIEEGYSLSDYDFNLPTELIAQQPLARRDDSRLLELEPEGQQRARQFRDLPNLLRAGDCLVLNDTKVIPARLYGDLLPTNKKVEFLLLKRLNTSDWLCLCKPAKKLLPGQRVVFLPERLEGEIIALAVEGQRIIRFHYQEVFEELLAEIGLMPLPPYIHEQLREQERYQTVYATELGSAAAPTAGLHFTPELLLALQQSGVSIAKLTLHVGIGTFRPVKVANIREHIMHSESFSLDAHNAELINQSKARGGRVIAVGTTSCRVLETVAEQKTQRVRAQSGSTDIFIYPPYEFKLIDGLITNFHLPKSSLLMLVAALAGRERILAAYQTAIEQKYRFFSFGDAMLIWRGK